MIFVDVDDDVFVDDVVVFVEDNVVVVDAAAALAVDDDALAVDSAMLTRASASVSVCTCCSNSAILASLLSSGRRASSVGARAGGNATK